MTFYKRTILITGAAGFIGAALAKKFLLNRENIIGIDNLNNYYDVKLKKDRLDVISNNFGSNSNWTFLELDLEEKRKLDYVFQTFKPDVVINLAAQAGVRYSLENPDSYLKSNLLGFGNIIECCREFKIKNFIYASSSSVYGGNKCLPFEEDQSVDHPVSLYAATKKSNELMAHSYSHLFNLPSTGLRFFTVYGPWGRPDMAPMIFTKSIFNKSPIEIYNFGKMERDFTYIDDIVEAIYLCSFKPATIDNDFDSYNPNPSTSFAPHRIFNLGNSRPVELMKFIETLESEIGIKAIKNFKEIQPGDVVATAAETSKIQDWIKYKPNTSLKDGIKKFVKWFSDYYGKH
tara:strand:- start:2841 stop:3878 length:1038 start_codon:yes stop_codon:yes gene_type:complete